MQALHFVFACDSQNSIKSLQEEIERMKWLHVQALLEMQHNADLTMAEMRLTLEHEHTLKMKKLIQLHEEEREKTVEEVKKKQWVNFTSLHEL